MSKRLYKYTEYKGFSDAPTKELHLLLSDEQAVVFNFIKIQGCIDIRIEPADEVIPIEITAEKYMPKEWDDEEKFHAIPDDAKEEFQKGMIPQEEIDVFKAWAESERYPCPVYDMAEE